MLERLIVALDAPSAHQAVELAERLVGRVGAFKVGLELLSAEGPRAIRLPGRVFYDTKFHDIPNTVAGAAAAIGRLGAWMFTMHICGGRAMLETGRRAAAQAAEELGHPPPLSIGVTVLTSLDREELQRMGIRRSPARQVMELALLGREAGLDGVVCSAHEVEAVKRACGRDFLTVVPGIRLAQVQDDQRRVATPAQAMAAGADYLVVGRPITRAGDPAAAAREVVDQMEAGAAQRAPWIRK